MSIPKYFASAVVILLTPTEIHVMMKITVNTISSSIMLLSSNLETFALDLIFLLRTSFFLVFCFNFFISISCASIGWDVDIFCRSDLGSVFFVSISIVCILWSGSCLLVSEFFRISELNQLGIMLTFRDIYLIILYCRSDFLSMISVNIVYCIL